MKCYECGKEATCKVVTKWKTIFNLLGSTDVPEVTKNLCKKCWEEIKRGN